MSGKRIILGVAILTALGLWIGADAWAGKEPGRPTATAGGCCGGAGPAATQALAEANVVYRKEAPAGDEQVKAPRGTSETTGDHRRMKKAEMAHAKALVRVAGQLTPAMKALDQADQALQTGQTDKAREQLTLARKHVHEARQLATAHERPGEQAEAGIVNARCPIMGSKIDPEKVPANLTRTWKGQKVGFCCGGCPRRWDALDESAKQVKLDAAGRVGEMK